MNEILIGDCRQLMRALVKKGARAQTCITSPPYFGLRDYGTASWDGGDSGCDHRAPKGDPSAGEKQKSNEGSVGRFCKDRCGKCGAVRIDDQLGLETTPTDYVERMVEVFRLVRDLLEDDGTLWLNLGDSYAGSWGNYGGENRAAGKQRAIVSGSRVHNAAWDERTKFLPPAAKGFPGIKPKDLIGIPWRVAFALQADGWYLRSDVIWHKPNVMPESVGDRPTKSHEYIFLLSKSADYFYDSDAISEPADPKSRNSTKAPRAQPPGHTPHEGSAFGSAGGFETRNKRTVWTVSTQGYEGAHFATFPPELILPCVLAGSRAGDVVFDPFMGSGTTAFVAKENGRRYLGCELNPAYEALQLERLRQEVLFGEEAS